MVVRARVRPGLNLVEGESCVLSCGHAAVMPGLWGVVGGGGWVSLAGWRVRARLADLSWALVGWGGPGGALLRPWRRTIRLAESWRVAKRDTWSLLRGPGDKPQQRPVGIDEACVPEPLSRDGIWVWGANDVVLIIYAQSLAYQIRDAVQVRLQPRPTVACRQEYIAGQVSRKVR
ncbi:hypothetical protein ACSSS7_006696 [Eimeria intestinalis]